MFKFVLIWLAWLIFSICQCSAQEAQVDWKDAVKRLEEADTAESAREASRQLSEMISGLGRYLVSTLNNQDLLPETRAEACYLLGMLRFEQGVEALAQHIDFEYILTKEMSRIPRWSAHPCQEALIRIGKPSVGILLELIKMNDSRKIRDFALMALYAIEGVASAKFLLKKEYDESVGEHHKRLFEAMNTSRQDLGYRMRDYIIDLDGIEEFD